MSLGILISGLLAAGFGALIAMIVGLDLSSTLFVYGIFGVCGGVLACLAGLPMLRNLGRHRASRNRGIS